MTADEQHVSDRIQEMRRRGEENGFLEEALFALRYACRNIGIPPEMVTINVQGKENQKRVIKALEVRSKITIEMLDRWADRLDPEAFALCLGFQLLRREGETNNFAEHLNRANGDDLPAVQQ